jgi:hypothetical protein
MLAIEELNANGPRYRDLVKVPTYVLIAPPGHLLGQLSLAQ